MKFLCVFSALCASAIAMASSPARRQSCAEASRFGDLEIVPTDLYPQASYTVHIDFTCALDLGYPPKYLDFYIETLNNNGYQPNVLIARREFELPTVSNPGAYLTFTAQIPEEVEFYAFPNSSYVVGVDVWYERNTTDNQIVYILGSPATVPINITISD